MVITRAGGGVCCWCAREKVSLGFVLNLLVSFWVQAVYFRSFSRFRLLRLVASLFKKNTLALDLLKNFKKCFKLYYRFHYRFLREFVDLFNCIKSQHDMFLKIGRWKDGSLHTSGSIVERKIYSPFVFMEERKTHGFGTVCLIFTFFVHC